MNCIRISIAFAILLAGGLSAVAQMPVRALAQDYVIVAESPEPQNLVLYNPTILALPDGRLVGGYLLSNRQDGSLSRSVVVTSDDGGASWTERTRDAIGQARLFSAGDAIYQIGSGARLRIMRSLDRGTTWSNPVQIDSRAWHQTASNVWYANGNVYLAMEHRVERNIDAWAVGEFAPVVMRAAIGADLLNPASWRFSEALMFVDLIPGYRDNQPQIDGFGIPFFPQSYPGRTQVGGNRTFSPMGWLETNIVQVMDPGHFWYDPSGHTFHLLMRANTGVTNIAALARMTEQPDGTMRTALVTAPSGVTQLFMPMPGGHMRFHVLYDSVTRLYWLLGSQSTDSMRRPELLPPERFSTPDNERHRMVLHFSRNLVDWCFAGLVDIGPSPREARHYASMDIDGDDLVILSRSGDARARSAHDGNLITFHRVRNFRDLVY